MATTDTPQRDMDPEKQPLLIPVVFEAPHQQPFAYTPFLFRLLAFYVLASVILSPTTRNGVHSSIAALSTFGGGGGDAVVCQQYGALVPSRDEGLEGNKAKIFSEEYRTKSAGILGGLVQVHSESFDDLGEVGVDSRWNVFYDVSKYLLDTFPLVHEKLKLDKVNTHGLVYTWVGSDESLKPVLLMAHQDTVPVNMATIADWTYPPWSGHIDHQGYLWGRGASDCKNTLTATLESVTLLLEQGFQPRRTVILAYGMDEESKGYEGAGQISQHLESIYGKDGIALILDEGGLGIGEMYGTGFALPATGEKGYLDVNFTLSTPGGHSSIPPPHTGIGILAAIVTSLESSPYSPSLSLESPIFSLLQCAATHGDLPGKLKKSVAAGGKKGKKGEKGRREAAERFAEFGRGERYLVSTSQAVDVIGGGVKVNALPELSYFVANYRIAVDSSASVIEDRISRHLEIIGKRYSLDIDAFGELTSYRSGIEPVATGHLVVTGINELEPAPVTPTGTKEWETLAATIQHVYASRFDKGLVVSPCVMTGNTDTRFHWNNSKNIYRFTPMDKSASFGIHTIDEHLFFDDHVAAVWFFHEFIRNADAADF